MAASSALAQHLSRQGGGPTPGGGPEGGPGGQGGGKDDVMDAEFEVKK
jgi:hypothetical protein